MFPFDSPLAFLTKLKHWDESSPASFNWHVIREFSLTHVECDTLRGLRDDFDNGGDCGGRGEGSAMTLCSGLPRHDFVFGIGWLSRGVDLIAWQEREAISNKKGGYSCSDACIWEWSALEWEGEASPWGACFLQFDYPRHDGRVTQKRVRHGIRSGQWEQQR
jgi:hypothetical protein